MASDLIMERRGRAAEWKQFRKDWLFTQRRLASVLGISRRTVQDIEAAKIVPHTETLSMFETLKRKHEDGGSFLYAEEGEEQNG